MQETKVRDAQSHYVLVEKTDSGRGKLHRLSGEVDIGRNWEDITLRDEHASRKHARITVRDGDAFVEDRGSRNGTFVNGRRIDAETQLSVGDELRFDMETFVLERVNDAPPDDAEGQSAAADDGEATPQAEKMGPGSRTFWWPDRQGPGRKTELAGTPIPTGHVERGVTERFHERVDDMEGPCLVGVSRGWEDVVIELRQPSTIVGRAKADYVIEDPKISQPHAQIFRKEGESWCVVDLISTHGTYVNGHRTTGAVYLNEGDAVRFGHVEFRAHRLDG